MHSKKSIECEVEEYLPTVSEIVNLNPSPQQFWDDKTVAAFFDKINQEAKGLEKMTEDQLAKTAYYFGNTVNQVTTSIGSLEISQSIARWVTGHVLIAIKGEFEHGDLSQWFDTHRQQLGFTQRTGQNYMKIARQFPDVKSLIVSLAKSKMEDAASEGDDEKEDLTDMATSTESTKPSSAQRLLTTATAFQKSLRQMVMSDTSLDEIEVLQLTAAKQQIDQHFNTLLT